MPAGGTVIDSLWIALGFAPSFEGLDRFKARAQEASTTLLSYGAAAGAVLGGLAIKAIANISDEFEQNMLVIAGTFSALGVSSDFNSGLKDAEATLDKITIAAAKLPGEASDYIEVFRAGLTGIKGAMPTGTIDEMVDFSNTFAAVGKSLGVDARQIGRDLSLMLGVKGHAGADVQTFQKMLPFLMQVEGQAGITAESFNKLGQAGRLDLLRKSFVKLQPMLDASAESFDAMKGAALSAGKQMLRMASVGLFKGMKEALKKINAVFFDENGVITATGKAVVDFGRQLGGMVTQAVSSMAALVEWFLRSDTVMTAVKVTAGLLALAMAGLAFEKVAKGVGTLLYALTNLKRLFTGALVVAIGLVADDLYTFATGGDSVTGMLVEKVGPAMEYVAYALLPALGLALAYVNREAVMTAFALVRPVLPLILVGAAIVGVVKLWNRLGEKGKAAMVLVGTMAGALFLYLKRGAIQTAVGLALMNLPIIIMIGTLVALAAGIYYVTTRWKDFGAGAKTAIVAVATVLGVLAAAYVATQGAAIASAVASAAAWLAALAPVAIGIVAVGILGVALYELVKHWNAVEDAIWNAVDAVAKFLHLSDDASGRKDRDARRSKSDAAMAGLGDGTFDKTKRLRSAGNDGESTDFLKKRPKGGGAPVAAPAGGSVMDRLKAILPAGMDLDSLIPGLSGMAPAAAGGAPGLPPGIFDMLGGKGGGTTNVTNTQTTHVGGISVDARGMKDADEVARKVEERLNAKNQRVIRSLKSPEEGE